MNNRRSKVTNFKAYDSCPLWQHRRPSDTPGLYEIAMRLGAELTPEEERIRADGEAWYKSRASDDESNNTKEM